MTTSLKKKLKTPVLMTQVAILNKNPSFLQRLHDYTFNPVYTVDS